MVWDHTLWRCTYADMSVVRLVQLHISKNTQPVLKVQIMHVWLLVTIYDN